MIKAHKDRSGTKKPKKPNKKPQNRKSTDYTLSIPIQELRRANEASR